MFRLVSKRVPLAALAAVPLARFQSSSVVGESAAQRQSSNRRNFKPTNTLPKFEIHDVRDDPAHGSMTRVSVDGKQLLVSQFPQLGPRKADPNDTTPQFDRERRISMRFRHMDLAAFVGVVEDRLPAHHVKNNAFEVTFEKVASGYELKGQVHRGQTQVMEEWSVRFENQFAVTMEHFLQGALTESFGFAEHQRVVEEQSRGQANANSNNNNSSNNNRNRRRNNSNNNNRNNNNRNRNAEEAEAQPAQQE